MHTFRSFVAALLLTFGACPLPVLGAYSIVDDFSGPNFFSGFTFFTDRDPTNGFVKYLNQGDAQAQGLVSTSGSTVYVRVDSKNQAPNGRASVRLSSKRYYNRGLYILDLAHMPASTCGTWPSFWTYGPEKTWPANGEIDIIEGVHTNTVNSMSLHTSDGCSIDGSGSTGSIQTKNCYVNAVGQSGNAGCAIQSNSAGSYGTPFNQGGGGVFAMERTSSFIKLWFFPRNALPGDILGNSPNPSTWGTPQANFAGACNFDQHFINHQIVLDTTFCGDWAGATWASNPTCAKLAGNCNDYVNKNPGAFAESYWAINSLKVFSQ